MDPLGGRRSRGQQLLWRQQEAELHVVMSKLMQPAGMAQRGWLLEASITAPDPVWAVCNTAGALITGASVLVRPLPV